jgi:protein ImuA
LVWQGTELAGQRGRVQSSGHEPLDAVLPGGGWPVGSLVELLQPQAGQGEWRLLSPALASLTQTGRVVLIDPPYEPFGPALAEAGLDVARLLRVRTAVPAEAVWAAGQVLACADVVALVAWLPRVRVPQLRRLQLLAQTHGVLLWVVRPVSAAQASSPAALRLQLQWASSGVVPGRSVLQVQVLKRKGPSLAQPVELAPLSPRLAALLHRAQPSVVGVDGVVAHARSVPGWLPASAAVGWQVPRAERPTSGLGLAQGARLGLVQEAMKREVQGALAGLSQTRAA